MAADRPVIKRGDREADRGIGLVDLSDRNHSERRLADAAAVDQPGRAAVARFRVNFVELDHQRPELPATIRIRTTMTIATAWNSTRRCIHFCDCSPLMSLPEAIAMTPRTRKYTTPAMTTSRRTISIGVMAPGSTRRERRNQAEACRGA